MLTTLTKAVTLRAKALLGPQPRDTGTQVCADMGRLLPAFREQVEAVLADMRQAGHRPRVFETWRSPTRIALLAARGTGSPHSTHLYGIAADIIDDQKLWGASSAFWVALCGFAEARGLTSGARFSHLHDLPHVQGIPVVLQPNFAAIGYGCTEGRDAAVDAERDRYARSFYRLPRQT